MNSRSSANSSAPARSPSAVMLVSITAASDWNHSLVTTPGSNDSHPPAPAVAVVGEFDGLHIGHQALLTEARRQGEQSGRAVVAVVLDRADGSPALTTAARRCELLIGAGAHVVVVA